MKIIDTSLILHTCTAPGFLNVAPPRSVSPEQREEARARGRAAVASNREEKRLRATERTISELERDSARTKVENVMAQQRAIGQRSSAEEWVGKMNLLKK